MDITVASGTAVFNADLDTGGFGLFGQGPPGLFTAASFTTTAFNGDAVLRGMDLGSSVTLNVNSGGSFGSTLILGADVSDLDGADNATTYNLGADTGLRITAATPDDFHGTINLAADSRVEFNTEAGIFSTLAQAVVFAADASVNLPSQGYEFGFYHGDYTFQNDLDLDGGAELPSPRDNTTVIVGYLSHLHLNGQIEADANRVYNGTFNVYGQLTIDTPGSNVWRNGGRLELMPVAFTLGDPAGVPQLNGDAVINTGRTVGVGVINTDFTNADGGSLSVFVFDSQDLANDMTFSAGHTLTLEPGSETHIYTKDTFVPSLADNFHQVRAYDLEITGGELELHNIFASNLDLYTPGVAIQLLGLQSSVPFGVFDTVADVIIQDSGGTPSGTAIAVTYSTTAVSVQIALAGDANLNQQVEQADLDAVLQNWGQNNTNANADVSWVTGDLNGNGQVEQGDLDQVLQNWGSAAAPDFRGALVPEPAAAVVGLLSLLLGRSPRTRRLGR